MFKETKFNKPKLTPEEEVAHKEVLRRQRILQGEEGEKARELLEKELAKADKKDQKEK